MLTARRSRPSINEHTRAIMCTNPGNPTGVVLTPRGACAMMCDIAKEHDLFIIGDEAYREFVYGWRAAAVLRRVCQDAAGERHRHRHRVQALLRLRRACGLHHPDPQPRAAWARP